MSAGRHPGRARSPLLLDSGLENREKCSSFAPDSEVACSREGAPRHAAVHRLLKRVYLLEFCFDGWAVDRICGYEVHEFNLSIENTVPDLIDCPEKMLTRVWDLFQLVLGRSSSSYRTLACR